MSRNIDVCQPAPAYDEYRIIPFDPDRAKYHLKRADVGNKFELNVSTAAFQGAVDMTVLYKEHAAECGIEVEIVRWPPDAYWGEVLGKKNWLFSFWSGRPTADWIFSLGYAKGAKWNFSQWENDRAQTFR